MSAAGAAASVVVSGRPNDLSVLIRNGAPGVSMRGARADLSAVAQRAKAEAIQSVAAGTVWIASLSLSSGRALRGPVGSQ